MIQFLFATALVAASFDANMTPQDKKNTGVYKLSDEEKSALKKWVDNSYNAPTTKKANPSLSENLYNGSYLRLTDNSTWNVRPQDTPISQGWISEVEIVISQSGDPQYPTKLTNSISKSSVFARKVDSVPTPLKPATPTTKPATKS